MIVKLGENQNRILNIVKGKFGFRNKTEAINYIIENYEEQLEPELRPEYIEKLKRIQKEPTVKFKDIGSLRKLIEE